MYFIILGKNLTMTTQMIFALVLAVISFLSTGINALALWRVKKRSAVTEGTITAIFNDNGTAKGNRGRWAKVKFKLNGKTYYPEDRLLVSDLAEPGDPISLRYDKEKPTVLYRYSLFRLGGSGLICFFAVLYFVINFFR